MQQTQLLQEGQLCTAPALALSCTVCEHLLLLSWCMQRPCCSWQQSVESCLCLMCCLRHMPSYDKLPR